MNIVNVNTIVRGVRNNHTSRMEGSRFVLDIGTVPDLRPGSIEIEYSIENGIPIVPEFTSCSKLKANTSLLGWGFKDWDHTIDVLKVRFRSARTSISLHDPVSNSSVVNPTTIDTTFYNVFGTFSVSSYMNVSYDCPIQLMCPDNKSNEAEMGHPRAELDSSFSKATKVAMIGACVVGALWICSCCYSILTGKPFSGSVSAETSITESGADDGGDGGVGDGGGDGGGGGCGGDGGGGCGGI